MKAHALQEAASPRGKKTKNKPKQKKKVGCGLVVTETMCCVQQQQQQQSAMWRNLDRFQRLLEEKMGGWRGCSGGWGWGGGMLKHVGWQTATPEMLR